MPAQRRRSEPAFKRKKGPDARDIAVGQRVRALRLERSLSQTALEKMVYEKARIRPGKLATWKLTEPARCWVTPSRYGL